MNKWKELIDMIIVGVMLSTLVLAKCDHWAYDILLATGMGSVFVLGYSNGVQSERRRLLNALIKGISVAIKRGEGKNDEELSASLSNREQ